MMKSKIVDAEVLAKKIKALKACGNTIVSTSGCFDILHAGHVEYLEAAKKKGDVLIVMLNADVSVRALKGAQRPVVGQYDRAVVLAGLEAVDYVCIFDELTPCGLIRQIKPDIIVKGGDYQGMQIPEMEEAASYGGTVEYVLLLEGRSTTGIIKKTAALQTTDAKTSNKNHTHER